MAQPHTAATPVTAPAPTASDDGFGSGFGSGFSDTAPAVDPDRPLRRQKT